MRAKTIYLLIFAFVISTYLSGRFPYNIVTNSDSIYAYSLFKSILTGNSSIFDWYPSPSPYVFPDLLLYFFSFLIGFGDVFYVPLVYIVLQMSLFYISIIYILRNLFNDKNHSELSLLILLSSIFMAYYYETYSIMLTPLFHFGVLIACFFSIGLLYGRENKSPTKYFALYVLSFISSYSDNMYVIWFSLPSTGIAITLLILKNDKKYLLPSFLCLAASLLGMLSTRYLFINSSMYGYSFNESVITNNLIDAFNIFSYSWYGCLLLISLFIIAIYSAKCTIEKNYGVKFIISLYYIYSFLSTLIILSFQDSLPQADRYYSISFFMMFPMIFYVFLSFVKIKHITYVCAFFIILVFLSLPHVSFIGADQQCLIQNIKSTNIRNGVSGYWDSKRLMAYDDTLSISQVDQNMNAYRWITSETQYHNDAYFAILNNNDSQSIRYDALINLNGNPSHVGQCGDYKVLFYNKPIIINSLKNVGDTSIFSGALLNYANYKKDGNIIYPADDFSGGNFSFGPFAKAYEGDYEYVVTIKNNKMEDVNGYIDVANKSGKNIIDINNFNSNSSVIKVSGKFSINSDDNNTNLEIRTFLRHRYDISIDNIYIKKTK
ncbi:hypothetical protein FQE96_12925 [Escherichia coli]|nr:hypothetical protein [Escherichia coli]